MTQTEIETKAKQYWTAVRKLEQERDKPFGSEAMAASYERTAARLERELENAGVDVTDYKL